MKYLDRDQVLIRIHNEIRKAGGQAKLASKLGVTEAYISQIASGKTPGAKVRELIGVEKVKDMWRAVK